MSDKDRQLEKLTRAINTPDVIKRVQAKYGDDRIDQIGKTDNYMDGMAALARGLSLGLDAAGIRGRKARRVTKDMLDMLMSAATICFMLGYEDGENSINGGEEPWDGGLKEIGR